ENSPRFAGSSLSATPAREQDRPEASQFPCKWPAPPAPVSCRVLRHREIRTGLRTYDPRDGRRRPWRPSVRKPAPCTDGPCVQSGALTESKTPAHLCGRRLPCENGSSPPG